MRLPVGIAALAGIAVAATDTSILGECKPLDSLSFAHSPTLADGLSAFVIYNGLAGPRSIRIAGDEGNYLVVLDRGTGIIALSYRSDSTCTGWERRLLVNNTALNHGFEIGRDFDNSYFYASTRNSVYRWKYDRSDLSIIGGPTTIVSNITSTDKTTLTLLFHPSGQGSILVSRGSTDEDQDAGFGQIRRFPVDETLPRGTGWSWEQGEILAWGLRNTQGMTWPQYSDYIWGVESSPDNASWRGVDVHQSNPADELNMIPLRRLSTTPDKFYGYPTCYTAWDSSAVASSNPQFTFDTGAQFSSQNSSSTQDDAWCASDANNIKPVLSIRAHSAPVGIEFYGGVIRGQNGQPTTPYGLNLDWTNHAFVSLHGSSSGDAAAGYKIIRIPYYVTVDNAPGGTPSAASNSREGYETILAASDMSKCPEGCIRPTGLTFDGQGRLYVTSDSTGEVFIIQSSSAQHLGASVVLLMGAVLAVVGALI